MRNRNHQPTRKARTIKIAFAVFLFGAICWFALRTDPKVEALNKALQDNGSLALRRYPYTFAVVRLDDGVALMGTPRSLEVPVYRMIGAIYPNLSGRPPNDPDFVAAELELAQVQSEARQIVLNQQGVTGVEWQLDQNWLIEHNIQLN